MFNNIVEDYVCLDLYESIPFAYYIRRRQNDKQKECVKALFTTVVIEIVVEIGKDFMLFSSPVSFLYIANV